MDLINSHQRFKLRWLVRNLYASFGQGFKVYVLRVSTQTRHKPTLDHCLYVNACLWVMQSRLIMSALFTEHFVLSSWGTGFTRRVFIFTLVSLETCLVMLSSTMFFIWWKGGYCSCKTWFAHLDFNLLSQFHFACDLPHQLIQCEHFVVISSSLSCIMT